MSRKEKVICPRCGNDYLYARQKQCWGCDERDEREKRESRYEVIMLNAVDDLDGLKQWIKEHLIK